MHISYKHIEMKYTYIYMKLLLLSHVQLFETPWTGAFRVLLTMGFSIQEYQSG